MADKGNASSSKKEVAKPPSTQGLRIEDLFKMLAMQSQQAADVVSFSNIL